MHIGSGQSQLNAFQAGHQSPPSPASERLDTRKREVADVRDAPTLAKKASPGIANAPSYDAFFVGNDDEFSTLAWQLLDQQHSTGYLSVIQCPEDLLQGSLAQEVRIGANGVPQSNDGLLFNGTPVTLLVDFRQFPPARIPELNELFERPARLKGRELGNNVRIVTVVSPGMLPTRTNAQDCPGQDFWWRINGTCPPQLASNLMVDSGQTDNHSLQTWLDQNIVELDDVLESMATGPAATVIDFTGRDWHSLLFGSPGVDDNGQLVYQPGALEGMQAGQTLILKNAPWKDQTFVVQLVQALHSGSFHCNGSEAQLPANLKLFRQPLSEDEIKTVAGRVLWSSADPAPQAPALINQDNFAQMMREYVLTPDSKICRRDMLAKSLEGCDGIRVTSPLTQDQWLLLISRLRQANLLHLPVSTDVPGEQPPFFKGSVTGTGPAAQPMTFIAAAQVNIEQCEGNCQLPLSASGAVAEFVILPEHSLTSITQRSEVVSLQNRQFHCQLTHLVECLKAGTPVCLSGLQSNPVLLRQLETLLCPPPHLVLFGQREYFPNMRLTITWPGNRTMPSPVWQAFADATREQTIVAESDAMETDTDVQQLRVATAFRKLHDTLGRLQMATYCPAQPPGDFQQLFRKVLEQAGLEQQLDGCKHLQPCHIYQAVNSVVLKEYRANREVYNYLKHLSARLFSPDTSANWVDLESLRQWLARHPCLDRETVRKQFWSLARAFPANLFPDQQRPGDETVDKLVAMLVILAAGDNADLRRQGQEYARLSDAQLSVAEQTLKGLRNRSLRREKIFYNRLLCLDNDQRQPGSILGQARLLAAVELLGQAVQEMALDEVLAQEAGHDTELLQGLCSKQYDWHSWEQRRIKRLAEKVRHNPVVCIKGETGAGKSYIAEAVARILNPDQPPQVITVGPETELSDLLGRRVLKPAGGNDLHTEQQPTPLTLWAEQNGKQSGQPVVLIIDEANLAIPELWNCLKGLYDDPPCLHAHGERIPVSPNHRIIMTGNPDHFSGRRMNELLRVRAPQLYYKPLDPDFIQEQLLRPGLTEILKRCTGADSNLLKHCVDQLVSSIELLYPHYQKLLPGRVFTPRDLADLISRIQATLAENTTSVEFTEEGLNGLVWQAFEDTLGGEVSEQKQAEKKALEFWYRNQRPWDNSLTRVQQEAFDQFYNQWLADRRTNAARLDYTNDSTRFLMQRIWLEQRRSLLEKKTLIPHRGRHATVISGPAGRGKSAMLDQQLTAMCRQENLPPPRQINAGYSSSELLQQTVSEAKQQGYPLIISELNLLRSEEIEGLLNNVITGQAAPGFHLYTTVNPASFVGRHRFSPALKSRFTCLGLSEYTDQDIHIIANRVLPNNLDTELREQVINWHLRLRHFLKKQGVLLEPAIADLQQLGQLLAMEYPLVPPAPEQLQATFAWQYSLYLMAAQCTLAALPDLPERCDTTGDEKAFQDLVAQLTQVLNAKTSPQPVVVTRQTETEAIQAQSTSHLKVPATLVATTGLRESWQAAALSLALKDWEQQSQSRECPCPHNTLYSACYRFWQQHFIEQTHSLARDLMPLDPEQQTTLEHPDNHQSLERVRWLFKQAPSPRGLELLWESLNPVRDRGMPLEQKLMEVSEQVSGPLKQLIPIRLPEKRTKVIDGLTQKRVSNSTTNQVFKDFPPRTQRMNILQLKIDGSQVKEQPLPMGKNGWDVVIPLPLQQPVYTMGEEHYGVVRKRLFTDRFVELPSLYAHQTITCLSTEPFISLEQLEVIRDRGTGQLLIRLQEQGGKADSEVNMELHYVVKQLCPSQGLEQKLPDSTNSPFNTLIDDKLLKRFNQTSPCALMEALAAWARAFKADKDVSGSAGTDILANIIRQQQGACRHRSWAVYAIAAARGVPVRLVSSDMHQWIEYSADGERSWEAVDLGGTWLGGEIDIQKPAFAESIKGIMFSPQELPALLSEAQSDPEDFADRMATSPEAVNRWLTTAGKAPLEINNPFYCFILLLTRPPNDLWLARKVLTSGLIDDRIFSEKQEHLLFAIATAFKTSSSQSERQLVLEFIYELKSFFKPALRKTATQNWWLFLKQIKTMLVRQAITIREYQSQELIEQPTFEILSYGVLQKNLLDDLTINSVIDVYNQFIILLESLTEEQRNTTYPKVMAKFEAFFEPYYHSIKAPVNKQLQAVSGDTATTDIKGSCPSFEQRLKTTCTGSGFSWSPEGEVVVDRLLKQLAPFRKQKASVGTRKVQLIQSHAKGFRMPGSQNYLLSGSLKKAFFGLINEQITLPIDSPKQPLSSVDQKDILQKANEFSENPTQETLNNLRLAMTVWGVTITDDLAGVFDRFLNISEKTEKMDKVTCELSQSFAGYLARQSKADRGNLGMYSLAWDEAQRGYQLLTSKEAILVADAQKGAFLPLPLPLVKKHLQQDDSESLFIDSIELAALIEEYCENLQA